MSNKHYNHNCDNNLGIGRFGGSSPIIILIVISILFCGNREDSRNDCRRFNCERRY